uniref:Putative secreted protein n=1 Tax=Anopheles triannulatus TaxID=58253 RepID=A0A2M4B784_9DIPT
MASRYQRTPLTHVTQTFLELFLLLFHQAPVLSRTEPSQPKQATRQTIAVEVALVFAKMYNERGFVTQRMLDCTFFR